MAARRRSGGSRSGSGSRSRNKIVIKLKPREVEPISAATRRDDWATHLKLMNALDRRAAGLARASGKRVEMVHRGRVLVAVNP